MFEGKVAIITGATGGLGAQLVASFAAEGALIVAAGIDGFRGAALAQELGDKGCFVDVDVTDPQACSAVVEAAITRFGRLDILINNAGIIHVGNSENTTPDDWRRVLSVNLDGPFYMCRAAMAHLREFKGAIVNVGSDFSLVGGNDLVAYCASKGGLLQMTKAMALDHAAEGVRVNIVCPTVMDTPMVDELARQLGNDPDEQRRVYDAILPTGRMIAVDEVADAVIFLASAKARHITGTSLVVDGGVTAR
ncbi:MAG: SDR family NAD(P)-dependent oxidoreductase [Alphaproteobacteria bacterium]|jgi:NAD(P)-dependent dehydrogenase (short-subunit alcohol dehydrogenase family)|nr:SDR family oxidoreductase [Rhodospirillaceae bacterium]MBT6203932.1 SDR family oxidoreductase [Rhodospirillaceae bacterium]MBT7615527.1 SDR family oxidoreductase [Rhodospirillaceae bacterium]MBT7647042.1 SDR family oxidoreductase [Rhodospirillaceae bacterium]MDG2481244.1 SDR family NAD(P)-dependent oxidoreductase [Alphaproteobacteria bacterium]